MDNKKTIEKMNIDQKALLLQGHNFWTSNEIKELNIPSIYLTDGPHGLRKEKKSKDNETKASGLGNSEISTAFPTASAFASSWDENLIYEIGQSIASECLHYNVQVLLGPGVNIKRNPKCGRNFEYYSEDPLLSGKLGASFVKGVQSLKVGACVKHFACNNLENHRYYGDSIVDSRALHEIYLKPFEIIVKEAKPYSVMCAYNKVNGVYASENKFLLSDILRDDWSFDGVVMTDWGAINDRVESLKAGLDLEMPGDVKHNFDLVKNAYNQSKLSRKVVDKSVNNMLNLINKFDGVKFNTDVDFEKNHQVALKASLESAVLLKNDNNAFPLSKDQKILVMGQFFEKMRYQGAGSSLIEPTKLITPKMSFDSHHVNYEYVMGYDENDEKIDSQLIVEAISKAQEYKEVLLFVGLSDLYELEGMDRKNIILPPNQMALIVALINHNIKIKMVSFGGAPFIEPFINKIEAQLHMYLPGQAGGESVYKLLFNEANPCGKLAETWPKLYSDVLFYKDFDKYPYELYKESIFVGYRYYQKAEKDVLFPFGYGLSYSQFKYSNISLSSDKNIISIKFTIENTSSIDGKEIAQVYVSLPNSNTYRPVRELKGFKKVFVKAHQKEDVEIKIKKEDLKYFEIACNNFVLEKGNYVFEVGASVEDIKLRTQLSLNEGDEIKEVIAPTVYKNGEFYKINREEFKALLNYPIVLKKHHFPYTMDTPFSVIRKSIFGAIVIKQMMKIYNDINPSANYSDSEINKKKNELFMDSVFKNGTFKQICFASGGLVDYELAKTLLAMCNGHLIKGMKELKKIKL